jgi:hypothetical protein
MLSMNCDGQTLFLEIQDDGIGGASLETGGTGLKGMADRATALGGRLTISSPPGEAHAWGRPSPWPRRRPNPRLGTASNNLPISQSDGRRRRAGGLHAVPWDADDKLLDRRSGVRSVGIAPSLDGTFRTG